MSRLEDLIKNLCPDGVEFKALGKVLSYEQPQKYIVKSTNYETQGTPVLTAGQTFVLGYTNETDGIFHASKENPVIIFDDFTTSFHWVDFKFKVKSSAMKILHLSVKNASFRFIYYAMKCIKYETLEHSRQWISKYSLIKIPIPPLEVQQEIVRILDKFTELEARLEAEIETRKKQYQFYREKLFETSGDVKIKTLGEIGRFVRGNGLQKEDFVESGVPCIHYGQIHTHYDTFVEKTISFVTSEVANKLRKAQKGDVVIVCTSEDVDDVCKCIAWMGDEDVCIGGETYIFKHNQNPKYLAYYLQTDALFKFKRRNYTGTKVIRVHEDELKKFQVPVPSLAEQKRIADILDKFPALIEDISSEIKLRRKQCEYYRDKLLTFKQVA